MAVYFHLRNVSRLPLFAYIAHIEAICNEANERRKPLQYNTQQSTMNAIPLPPYTSATVNIRPLSHFFYFFLIFSLFLIVRIFHLNQDTQAVI